MSYAQINGLNIYYETHGEGEPVVLLHHGFGCTKMWEPLVTGLVEKGYRAITYDRRGFGRSDRGVDFLEFYVSDRYRPDSVKELAGLLQVLEIESFHAVGQCEGGVVGVEYAATYPDQVKSLVTASTMCKNELAMPDFNRSKFPETFQDLEPQSRAKFMSWHGEESAEPLFNQFVKFGGAYGKDFFDLRERLPDVECPTLVLYPDRSFLFEVEQAVEIYRHLPYGELAVIPRCGHNTYEQRPEEYLRAVLDFLQRHKGRPMIGDFPDRVTCIAAVEPPKRDAAST